MICAGFRVTCDGCGFATTISTASLGMAKTMLRDSDWKVGTGRGADIPTYCPKCGGVE